MVTKGKPPGNYESSKSVDDRTYVNVLFMASTTKDEWYFLYDVEDHDKPIPIGWYSQDQINKISLIEGLFSDIEDGDIREINVINLRAGTGYHPFYNPDPQGYRNGGQSIHSGPPLPSG